MNECAERQQDRTFDDRGQRQRERQHHAPEKAGYGETP
jgi:hypothetical protein